MFRNLYFQSRRFRDFNFTDCLGQIESISEITLVAWIRMTYESEPLEPCLEDTIRLTLRLETAVRFLKRESLPLTPRDFLISKLFQFLYLPLTIQDQLDRPGALPLRRRLEHWLDGLPQSAVDQLYRFDWPGFFEDSSRFDRPTLLARLDGYLPATSLRLRRAPAMGRRGPVPDVGQYKEVARAVQAIGEGWTRRPILRKLAGELDGRRVLTPEAWAKLDPPATTWRSAVETHPRRVVKIVKYRLGKLRQMQLRLKAIRRGQLP